VASQTVPCRAQAFTEAPVVAQPCPLERLGALGGGLDGRQGRNRADLDRLQIRAETDIDAIECFLQEFTASPGTWRTYRKEAERLLLWAILVRGRALSDLDRQDFEAYLNFLADPQPRALWCGPRRPRSASDWRPFVGPLGRSAQVAALACVNSLMTYLVEAGYVRANPLALIRQRRRRALAGQFPALGPERYLDGAMQGAVFAALEDRRRDTPRERHRYERDRFLLALLFLLAPRAGELEAHRMNSFREVRGRWWWYVLGKGDKPARIPVNDDLLAALQRYRAHLGLTPLPSPEDETPLLLSLNGRRGITARRLNQILKELFHRAAERLETQAPHKAARLRRASAHWGRHTGITGQVDSGLAAHYVQRHARHADPRTTDRYIHTEDERWHEAAQQHRLPWFDDRETDPGIDQPT